jgi:DNA-directed RNA polymerase subunit RPC12/RpoP
MDRGVWTLRCQMCGKDFEIEMKPGERIIQYAQEAACPHCFNAPGSKMESDVSNLWHHITGHRLVRDD